MVEAAVRIERFPEAAIRGRVCFPVGETEFPLRELLFPLRELFLPEKELEFPVEETSAATRSAVAGFAKFTIPGHYAGQDMSWMIHLWPQATAMSGFT
ncbi:MAG: hypothetical protein K2W91_11205 [Novosphingobium sp.]|nr:hypothetical protein [Novosphingobium sp.]